MKPTYNWSCFAFAQNVTNPEPGSGSGVPNPMENYRIIILPWPEFTNATTGKINDGGDLIEGNYIRRFMA